MVNQAVLKATCCKSDSCSFCPELLCEAWPNFSKIPVEDTFFLFQYSGTRQVCMSYQFYKQSFNSAVLQGRIRQKKCLTMCKTDRDVPQTTCCCNRSKKWRYKVLTQGGGLILHT